MGLHLAGGGVVLREFVPADWPAVLSYMSRRDVHRYLPNGGPLAPRDVKAMIGDALVAARAVPRTTYVLAVTRPPSPAAIGTATLVVTGRRASIAVVLHPDHWSSGVGTATGRLLLAFAFDDLGLEAVVARVHPDNVRSRRACAKLGLVPAGCDLFVAAPPARARGPALAGRLQDPTTHS